MIVSDEQRGDPAILQYKIKNLKSEKIKIIQIWTTKRKRKKETQQGLGFIQNKQTNKNATAKSSYHIVIYT